MTQRDVRRAAAPGPGACARCCAACRQSTRRAGSGGAAGARRAAAAARGRSAALRRQGPTSRKVNADRRRDRGVLQGRTSREFSAPEQATIEYVVLDLDALKKGITVTDEDLRKYYEQNQARYTAAEERRAQPHPGQGRQGRAEGRAQTRPRRRPRRCSAEVRKNPASFAELAKKNSDDPGSAAQGGDLDFFGRGAHGCQAVRGRGVRDEAGRDQRRGRDRVRLPRHQARRHARRREASRSRRCAPRSRPRWASSKRRKKCGRGRRAVHQHGLRAARQPAAGDRQAQARQAQAPPCSARRRPAPPARWHRPSCSTRCSATTRCKNKRNTDAIEIGAEPAGRRRASSSTSPRARCRWPRCRTACASAWSPAGRGAGAQGRRGAARAAEARRHRAPQLPADADRVAREAAVPAARGDRRRAARRCRASCRPCVGVDLGEQGYAWRVSTSVVAARRVGEDERSCASSTRQRWAAAEAQAYYDALKRRYKVEVTRRTRRRRSVASPRADGPLMAGRRYNPPLSGGCSSVGRVPDCDSGCRGFESHQPPQHSRMSRRAAPKTNTGARSAEDVQ